MLIGEGEVLSAQGRQSGRDALAAAGLTPVRLGPKEGLALINGTQASTAVLALALGDAWRLARAADVAAALSIDALRGSTRPFDPRIHRARPHAGQAVSAANIAALLEGSAINASHANCGRVQDAYSVRCAAQVHGAARDVLAFATGAVLVEANASTDNPMVFADDGDIVSGGNFHGAPVAIAADLTAIAVDTPGDDQRAPGRAAGQPGAQRAAGVPHDERRPGIGADAGAGDRGRAGV